MGLRILIELASSARFLGRLGCNSQDIFDSALGTGIYTFAYGQSATMLSATLPDSIKIMVSAALLCIAGGLLLAERHRAVWFIRLAGGLLVCVSAVLLFVRELGNT
jgi:hypothetical protein